MKEILETKLRELIDESARQGSPAMYAVLQLLLAVHLKEFPIIRHCLSLIKLLYRQLLMVKAFLLESYYLVNVNSYIEHYSLVSDCYCGHVIAEFGITAYRVYFHISSL